MKKVLLLFGLVFMSSVSFGQDDINVMTTKFFKLFEKNTDNAFDYIFGTNPWISQKKEGIEKVKSKISDNSSLMGAYTGYEKLTEKSLGESLKISVYLVKYERQPLRFIFKFYKAKNDWVLYNLKFDEDIDDDLEEMMKSDYLNGN